MRLFIMLAGGGKEGVSGVAVAGADAGGQGCACE